MGTDKTSPPELLRLYEERTKQVDAVIDQMVDMQQLFQEIAELVRQSQGPGNHQTVIHKTVGIGPWGAAAVTACFCTFLGLILLAAVLVPDIHDLLAWNDIIRAKVARLEAGRQAIDAPKPAKP